jgi:hypothetical protein
LRTAEDGTPILVEGVCPKVAGQLLAVVLQRAFIAAAGTEANYKVTLTWKREEKKPEEKRP